MSDSAVRVVLDTCDFLECRTEEGRDVRTVIGCSQMSTLVKEMRAQHGEDPRAWPVPTGLLHHEILLREFVLRVQGKWKDPFPHAEICHCRMIPTRTVDQAIIAGAHTLEAVRLQTSANTACGTCQEDVQGLIDHRLKS